MCIELGIDGIRADVGRAKPPQFWDIITSYARSKDPEFGFLAECYTYEDASPMKICLQTDLKKLLIRDLILITASIIFPHVEGIRF